LLPDRLAAVTGGTGFLGRHVVAALAGAGWQVRLLARRDPDPPCPPGVELVRGDLADGAALSRLVRGAGAVVHAAGLVKARGRREFLAVNRDGAARLAEALAREVPGARFVLVSSQAARCPELSPYAESKRAGEDAAVAALGAASWVVLRPCVIYGPWDREGLALLRLAGGRVVPCPRPEPRIAMVHVRDAAAAVVALCGGGPSNATVEIGDGRADGYGWGELMREAGRALGRTPRLVAVPDLVFHAAGAAGDGIAAASGRAAMFGRGKAREFLHRDWSGDTARRLPATLWAPRVDLRAGLAETVAWWRSEGTRI
jgi:nucleoside-diphosphate-sugar epimerase